MAAQNSQQGCSDPLDALIDFSEYETTPFTSTFKSPALSPSTSASGATRSLSNTPAILPSQPVLSGPSHNYELYRQTTGIPRGSVADTLAINQSNAHINQFGLSTSYMNSLSPHDELMDFGTAPGQTPFNPATSTETDFDFDSALQEPAFFFPSQSADFVNPSSMATMASSQLQTSNVGRLWPGMHQQQAAMAKAQAQQKQANMGLQAPKQQSQGPRGSQSQKDPLVESKISELLRSMRQNSYVTDDEDANSHGNGPNTSRTRKDEEDMDEDERLLASEEGKKLSSKERRQLRNKVSARAFRSRRKEYIGQLEGEITQKATENSELRARNRALLDENKRLADLTRMLLSAPAFAGFLNDLTTQEPNMQQLAAAAAPEAEPVQPRRDIDPFPAQQHVQQHVGMTMIPEQPMDYSMLQLDTNFSYQPQVFAVHSLPEVSLDAEILSGKAPVNTSIAFEDSKIEIPCLDFAPATPADAGTTQSLDEALEADSSMALFTSPSKASPPTNAELDITTLLAGIALENPCQYELCVDSEEASTKADAAMRRVNRMCNHLDSLMERLRSLTADL